MRARLLSFVAVCLIVMPSVARANNTSWDWSYSLMPGATASEAFVNDGSPERWYYFQAVSGRSYCAETQGGVMFDTAALAYDIDTVLTVYHADHTSVITSNNNALNEPYALSLSRACWIAASSELTYVRVSRAFVGDVFNFRVRLVETTLVSPWYFVGGNYSAYTTLRNTTNTSVTYRINWRSAAGAVVGVVNSSLGANASTFFDARAIAGVLPTNTNGTVEIVFNSSPGAIVANTTVLSATTGLSFDAPFTPRPVW